MNTQDVEKQFNKAIDLVYAAKEKIPFEVDSLAGLTLQLTDRLLQAVEMEQQERRVSPVIAGQAAERSLRGIN